MRNLEPLFYPIGFLWLLLLLGCVVFWWKRQKASSIWCLLLAVFVWVIGATAIPCTLLSTLEKPYVTRTPEAAPVCDAVVMLGGSCEVSKYALNHVNLVAASDRIFATAAVLREKKARYCLLGGGAAPGGRTEGNYVKEWIEEWRLAPGNIIPLQPSRDTHDEAVQVRKLMDEHKWQSILLVSSAFHLRRAEALFKSLGIPATPVGCDFQGLSVRENKPLIRLFPENDGFRDLTAYLHEIFGLIYYKMRGWA